MPPRTIGAPGVLDPSVLFIGIIRPDEGLEDLADAFDPLSPEEVTLGLTTLLLPAMGPVGVAVAWLVGQTLVAAVTFTRRRLRPLLRTAPGGA